MKNAYRTSMMLLLWMFSSTTVYAESWSGYGETLLLFFLGTVACLYAGISTLALGFYRFREGPFLTFICRAGLFLYAISLLCSSASILASFRDLFAKANNGNSLFISVAYLLIIAVGIFTNARYLYLIRRKRSDSHIL